MQKNYQLFKMVCSECLEEWKTANPNVKRRPKKTKLPVAKYNYKTEEKALVCTKHKLERMVDKHQRICIIGDCITQSCFNALGEEFGIYCKACAENLHKQGLLPEYENVSAKKCLTCKKQPYFNELGAKTGLYCATCVKLVFKKHEYEDVVHKRCLGAKCTLRPCYNVPGSITGIYCVTHAKEYLDEYEDVVAKVCLAKGCKTRPYFNTPGETVGLYCAKDAKEFLEAYEDVVHKKCEAEGCKTIPCFNVPGETVGMYCEEHAKLFLDEYENVVSDIIKCVHGINEYYCVPCKGKGICDHNIRRLSCMDCKGSGTCEHKPIRRNCNICGGSNICMICCDRQRNPKFVFEKPDGSVTTICGSCYWDDLAERIKNMTAEQIAEFVQQPRYIKKKEIQTTQTIITSFPMNTWHYQVHVPMQDTRPYNYRYYMDMARDVTSELTLAVEIDEKQHYWVSACDLKRCEDIVWAYKGKHLVFFRFNPDAYTDASGSKRPSMFTSDHEKTSLYEPRMQKFIELLHRYENYKVEDTPLLHIVFVNYDADSKEVQQAKTKLGEEQVEQYFFI